jgi:HEAT repeat protein
MRWTPQPDSARLSGRLAKQLGLVALVLAIASIALVLFTAPKRPQFSGKTATQWLMMLDAHVDKRKEHDDAASALCQIGQGVVPELRRILRRRPGSIPEVVRQVATRFHLLRPEPLPLYEHQSRAARAAYILAERANADISALIPDLRFQLIQSRYAEAECARALVNAGPEGIGVLTNLMVTGPRPVRDQAGWALGMATSKPEAVEALVRAADAEPDRGLRADTLLYLSNARGHDEVLVPLGLRFLQSEDGYDRWAGASLLASRVDADGVRAALDKAANDSDERVRSTAKRALNQ